MKESKLKEIKIYCLIVTLILNVFTTSVFSNEINKEKNIYVTTRNVLTFERNTKSVMYEKNGYVKVPMASTTKIMTAIIAIEYEKLNEVVTVSKNAQNVIGWQLNLKQGDKIVLRELLYATMLYSANDGAIAIAEHVGGSVEEFSKLMNQKAKEIGALNTNFTSPHGLDNPEHYSTAYDLALIMDYALDLELFKKIISTPTFTLNINSYAKDVTNTNKLLADGFIGKTGYTGNALYCLVTNKKEKDLDMIIVSLGSDTSKIRFNETKMINQYCRANYTIIDLKDYTTGVFKIMINKGKERYIYINTQIDKKTTIYNYNIRNIKVDYDFPKFLNAPVKQNLKIGTVTIRNNEEIIEKQDFCAKEDYTKMNNWDYLKNIINNYINLLEIS